MRFAVLADIHGNALALEAVLADMEQLGVTQAVNLGDFFSGPLDAETTADLLAPQDWPSILGNHDRYLIEEDPVDMGPSDKVAHGQLRDQDLAWLKTLPSTQTVFGDVFLCHGTPSCDTTYWLQRVEPNGMVRNATLAEVEREAAGVDASLILCGHTHIPGHVRLRDGRLIVNPGSLGCPAYDDDTPAPHHMQTGTPHASYAIVEGNKGDWRVTFHLVAYDWGQASAQAAQNGRPEWARALATGWFEA
ncbi:MAG: metallophosphoesterase family protein [Pseudomonadota bacterium]